MPCAAACSVSGRIQAGPAPSSDAGDAGGTPAADGGGAALADGGFRCSSDSDCLAQDGGACQSSTGQCLARSCLTDGCDAGTYCDVATLGCTGSAPGPHPTYKGETIAGHSVPEHAETRDGVGLSVLGDLELLVASKAGRYIYVIDEDSILRFDQANMRLETLSGLGWAGQVDGAADVAQYAVNFYQSGGFGLSPDEKYLYLTNVSSLRKVDLTTGQASTLAPPELANAPLRSLAVGASGTIYLNEWGPMLDLIKPDGTVQRVQLNAAGIWSDSLGTTPGFIVVDEQRGWVYGIDRNRQSGAFYRWPIAGGQVEWLNNQATGGRDPVQYLSDGPVAHLDMANPGGLSIDSQGYVYIGGGDGETFRRYNPDTQIVESLCTAANSVPQDNLFEWCIGDGVRNRLFNTWPQILTFDGAGNGYFGYTVWPRLIRLTKEN